MSTVYWGLIMRTLIDLDTGVEPDRIAIVKGETRTLRYQLKENGLPKNITGFTFKFAAKAHADDAAYTIDPIDGAIVGAATDGKFSFIVAPASIFNGVCEIALYDATLKKTVLTQPGGLPCRVHEDIID